MLSRPVLTIVAVGAVELSLPALANIISRGLAKYEQRGSAGAGT